MTVEWPNAEIMARKFHETYERLAPQLGYSTRVESAIPWYDVPMINRKLMIVTCAEILEWLHDYKVESE